MTPSSSSPRGRVAVLGAGPAGMAAALGALKAGHEVVVYERYREARPAGNILNLWPPPVKALRALGVDTDDLGAPTDTEFRNVQGRVRVRVKLDEDVKQAYGGGFIGLLRPELYERMLAAIPEGVIRFGQQVDRIEQDERAVTLHFADGSTAEHDVLIGADGIDSLVRRTLLGDRVATSLRRTPELPSSPPRPPHGGSRPGAGSVGPCRCCVSPDKRRVDPRHPRPPTGGFVGRATAACRRRESTAAP